MFTEANPETVFASADVAVTVTVGGFGAVGGAV
jgi:hypothetical protein